jgi:hypothetical protein
MGRTDAKQSNIAFHANPAPCKAMARVAKNKPRLHSITPSHDDGPVNNTCQVQNPSRLLDEDDGHPSRTTRWDYNRYQPNTLDRPAEMSYGTSYGPPLDQTDTVFLRLGFDAVPYHHHGSPAVYNQSPGSMASGQCRDPEMDLDETTGQTY